MPRKAKLPQASGIVNIQAHPGPQAFALSCALPDHHRYYREIYYGGARGGGKLSPYDSIVCTPKGEAFLGDLKVGDQVIDPTTGGPTDVVQIHEHGPMEIVRLVFDDGASLECGLEHLWLYRLSNHHKPGSKLSSQREFSKRELGAQYSADRWDSYRVDETKRLAELLAAGKKVVIPLTEPVIFTGTWKPQSELTPYLVGVYLGDGHLDGATITNIDPEICNLLLSLGYHYDGDQSYRATGEHRRTVRHFFYMHELLKCRAWEKFIPASMMFGPVETRLELLRGLLDTDGTVDKDGDVSYCSTSERLAKDVQRLAWSLGAKAKIYSRITSYTHKGEKKQGRRSYNVKILHGNPATFFKLQRKKDRCPVNGHHAGFEITRTLVRIEPVGVKPARCITVSSRSGLYLGNDFIVTHNSFAQILFLMLPAIAKDKNGKLLYPNYRGLLIRKNADDLRVLIDDAFKIYGPLGARPVGRPVYFQFPGGPIIFTGHLKDENSYQDYQGHEYHKIGIDEANQLPTESRYLALLGSLRNSPDGRPQVFLTGNPGGAGDGWIKRRFVKVKIGPNAYSQDMDAIYDPVMESYRIFIPAKVYDNPTLMKNDPAYVKNLQGQPEYRRRAWLDGDFDAFQGQALEEFRPNGRYEDEPPAACHVYDDNSPEAQMRGYWFRWLSMDWGHTHFAAVYKWALNPNGKVHCYAEKVARGMSSVVWGAEIAKWCLADLDALGTHRMTLYLSPDAFAKRDEPHTPAEGLALGMSQILGSDAIFLGAPTETERQMAATDPMLASHLLQARATSMQQKFGINIERANPNRMAGLDWVRELLRFRPVRDASIAPDWNYLETLRKSPMADLLVSQYLGNFKEQPLEVLPKLVIHRQSCPRIIESMVSLVLDPDKPEDVLKKDATESDMGDDEWEAFRMGALAYKDLKERPPKSVLMAERMEAARREGITDPTSLFQVAQHASIEFDKETSGQKPIRFGRIAVPNLPQPKNLGGGGRI